MSANLLNCRPYARLVGLAGAIMAVLTTAIAAPDPAAGTEIDLPRWVSGLPPYFLVSGVKTEPTYVARIDIWRDGDNFGVVGGAPAWAMRALQAVSVSPDGLVSELACPENAFCGDASDAGGYLSTAALVAAARKNAIKGAATVRQFGDYEVVCVPAEQLGVADPILDPCFELQSGATLALLHRMSQTFDGPSLSVSPLAVEIPSSPPKTPQGYHHAEY
ncbi:hypothetical protein K1W69_22145 [Hoeflea sp. WL0058]|uniref:Uncharacterized protein n=1 Tax=Flavimaribacter sediminis TaxID=2865987 RepID=A0AAE2ZSV6_9HYPH|nr:hypothetical protein [Flavimaribacter sediminis]MBW8639913.1 hypothetical protein [Flavimaribacter sediminis]